MAKHTEAFTKAGSDEKPQRRSRRGRKLIITDCGPDWSPFSEDEKVEMLASLAADDETAATISAVRSADKGPGGTRVEGKHIEWFLTAFEKIEQMFLPKLIEKKSKGEFKIDPDIAAQTLRFDEKQREKLVPLGVEAANKHLPERIKKALTYVGPGAEFMGELLIVINDQQVHMLTAQVNRNTQKAKNGNGQRPAQGQGPQGPQRPQRPAVPTTMQPFEAPQAPEATAAERKPIVPIGIKEQTA